MKRIYFFFLFFLMVVVLTNGSAQELNCTLRVNSDQIQGSNKEVFNTLQKSLTEFINNRRWTDLTYTTSERIECSMNIIIKKVDGETYTAEIQVQSRRPVYGSGYNTTLFNYKDNDFTFDYKEFDQLEFNQNTITSNLTAVVAFYAYVIIGYDMDSFSRLGGTSAFDIAENIVNAAQGANLSGWKAFENPHNRYALISNILDDSFKKFRDYFYEYHRLGLDVMSTNAANGRAKIAEGLPILRDLNRESPSALVISTFLDAKNDELINIFSKGTEDEKKMAVEILSDVNPTMSDRYQQILKQQ